MYSDLGVTEEAEMGGRVLSGASEPGTSCSDSLVPTRAKKGFELQMQVCLDLISVWGGS